MQKFADNVVTVLYDFQYTAKDKRLINVKQGEKLYLINKTNRDWWQVIRSCEERPFFVPAQYVVERSKQGQLKTLPREDVDYQNLDFLKLNEPEIAKAAKPVPKARTQLKKNINDDIETPTDKTDNDEDALSLDNAVGVSDNNNRMRNSYNLKKEHPKMERKQSVPLHKRKPLELGRTLSRSLEKLAEEIKFEPKNRKVDESENVKVSGKDESTKVGKGLSLRNKVVDSEKVEKGIFRGSVRGRSRDAGVILSEKAGNAKQRVVNEKSKTLDPPLVVDNRKPPSKGRGNFFSSFKRRKQAYVLSTSWEGLDKLENLEKPTTTAFGLQRSRTFMFPEKPKPRKRLDAYNVMTFSTFKTEVKETVKSQEEVRSDEDSEDKVAGDKVRRDSEESMIFSGESEGKKHLPFAGRKTSLVRKGRVDASSARLRVPASPPPDVLPLRDLGDGWGEYHSSDGRPYYYNRITGERNLKPPRRVSNTQHGSKDSIASDISTPIRSSPSESPKFPSGTSLDHLPFDGPRHRSRSSLDRLTPIEIPLLDHRTTPKSSPSYGSDRLSPLDNLPSDGEGLELSDHVLQSTPNHMVVPRGYKEEIERGKDGRNRKCYVNVGTQEKYQTWPPRKTSSKEILEKQLNSYKQWLESQYGGLEKPFILTAAIVDISDVIAAQDDTHERPCERPTFLRSPYQSRVSCDVFDEILQVIRVEIEDIDEMMAIFEENTPKASLLEAENLKNFIEDMKKESGEYEDETKDKGTNIFDDGRKREKPPVPPRRRHKEKSKEWQSITKEDENKNEFEVHELLMMKRVTESSKGRRKSSVNRKPSLHFTVLEEGEAKVTKPEQESAIEESTKNSESVNGVEDSQLDIYNRGVTVKECLKKWEESLVAENKFNIGETKVLNSEKNPEKEVLRETKNEVETNGNSGKEGDPQSEKHMDTTENASDLEDTRAFFNANDVKDSKVSSVNDEGIPAVVLEENEEKNAESKYTEIIRKERKPPVPPRKNLDQVSSVVLQEDLIIEWSNTLDGLHEPTVLESKSVPLRHPSSADSDEGDLSPDEEDMGVRSNSWSHARDLPLRLEDLRDWCEIDDDEIEEENVTEDDDRSVVDSVKTLETVVESIHEDDFDDTKSLDSTNGKESNSLKVADSTTSDIQTVESSVEDEFNYNRLVESVSDENFSDSVVRNSVGGLKKLGLSKSLDVVCEAILCKENVVEKCKSVPQDVGAWLSHLRHQVYEEDDFNKWYSSHNNDDLIYFYKENSNDSTWQLPEVNQNGASASGELYRIQRSATESAIPSETASNSIRLRKSVGPEKEEGGRGRASKTQSMIFDGKNFPALPLAEYRYCGVINRTRFGKKVKKSWVTTFAVLFHDSLNFYKDEKTFKQKIKAPGAYVSHSLVNATIEPAGSLSKKKNCFKISWPPDVAILIQTDKKEEAEEWWDQIQRTIDSIPPSPGPLPVPPSPSKVLRSKSLKAKPTRGSIEDITSAGGGENKNKISEYLKKFILRRPSSDALRLKGILKDEPVFGCSLEAITAGRNPRVPAFVQRCVEVIESTEENMKTDGLYRASGNLSQVQKIRLQVDQNNLSILEQEEDVHVLSGSLKLFFRELKEPLIPFNLFKMALEASRNENKKQKIKKLKDVMECLQPPNRDTLHFLLVHLLKVQSFKEFNRMHVANLAIVFGPTLVWGDEDTTTMALDLMQQNLVIECLLLEFNNIFPL